MNENIKKLLQKLANDPDAVSKINAIKTPDEAYEFASSIQDGFTKEEFIDAMTQLKKAAESGELSDEDLQAIAGGIIPVLSLSVVGGSLAAASILAIVAGI